MPSAHLWKNSRKIKIHMPQNIILILELIGTVAFAVSGATVGISRKMDLFGVITLGIVTSVGGGVIRDVVLGNTPPATFQNPLYAVLAILVSFIVFFPAVRRFLFKKQKVYESFLLATDSVGLGIFTVMGIEGAVLAAHSNFFLLLFVGLVTGTGGGVIRDILAGNTPYIFIKHFYVGALPLSAFVLRRIPDPWIF